MRAEAHKAGAVQLARTYVDSRGKKRATGNKKRLKASQILGFMIHDFFF